MYWSTLKTTKPKCASLLRTLHRVATLCLSPAFNSLYSPFDLAIGHYRRYAPKDAKRLTVQSLSLCATFFLDSAGFFASALINSFSESQPSVRDIHIWDKVIIPVSTLTDQICGGLFGRSIVMV